MTLVLTTGSPHINQDTTVSGQLEKNPFLNFLVGPRRRLARHLVFIAFLLFIFSDGDNEYSGHIDAYLRALLFVLFTLFVYTNMYLFAPRYLFKGRYVLYSIVIMLLTIGTFAFFGLMEYLLEDYRVVPKKPSDGLLRDILSFVFIIGVVIAASTAIKLFQRWVVDNFRLAELERQRLRSELTQLKSQINPHFLFNTLNNIYTLTQKDPKSASTVILKLSDLLRYQLYDSTQDQILLTSDISFIENFLNIEKIRRDNFGFSIYIEGNPNKITIPPFLFIPFIENAVKHSVDSFKGSYVNAIFTITDTELVFECENSMPLQGAARAKPGGIGLVNIQRRLQLLYPDRYTLTIAEHSDSYFVTLRIPL